MPYWFSTLTHTQEVPEDCLKQHLNVISTKWLYVIEYGKNNDNEHYHVLFQSEKYNKTSRYNEYFKGALYTAEFIKSLPNNGDGTLIRTRQANNWIQLYKSYLIKEQHNKTFANLRNNGFCEKTLRKLYKESGIESLIKNRVLLRFLQAPFVIYQNIHEKYDNYNSLFNTECLVGTKEIIEELRRLQGSGYIVHHLLTDKNIDQIIWSVNSLIKDGYEKFSQYNI